MDLKSYPKCEALLKQKVKEVLENIQKMMLGDKAEGLELPAIEQDYVDRYLESILNNNPRWLFDIFDENKIEIEIYRGWKYNVDDSESDDEFNNRVDCEKGAFEYAFNILEKQLK